MQPPLSLLLIWSFYDSIMDLIFLTSSLRLTFRHESKFHYHKLPNDIYTYIYIYISTTILSYFPQLPIEQLAGLYIITAPWPQPITPIGIQQLLTLVVVLILLILPSSGYLDETCHLSLLYLTWNSSAQAPLLHIPIHHANRIHFPWVYTSNWQLHCN